VPGKPAELTHQPTYALNKIHSEASIKLLHVSALGCHHQGVTRNKGGQGQKVFLCILATQYLEKRAGLILLCAEYLPDDGTPVPKHVGVLDLLLNVFY
jgi:hypothetical protein